MAIQKTNAIVLKTHPFRSSSLIITFMSERFGKMKGIAKGIRKEGDMRKAFCEPFSKVEIVFYEKTKSDLHLISEVSLLDTYPSLRSRLDSMAYASYFVELVDTLCELHDPSHLIYELLEKALNYLPVTPASRLTRIFELQLLKAVGWLPNFLKCGKCHKEVIESGTFFPSEGLLHHPECHASQPNGIDLSSGTLRALSVYVSRNLEEALKLSVTRTVSRDLLELMDTYLTYRLGKRLKTREFIHQIRPALAAAL